MQFVITPAAGKRLIAMAVAKRLMESKALRDGRIVIIAGTTNGYVAEELLRSLGRPRDFDRRAFARGVTVPPGVRTTESGRLPDESKFPGDLILVKGERLEGKTVFDVIDDLREGDIVVKGANCVDPAAGAAGILIGHPKGGTIMACLQAVIGRRVGLVVPVGLEKRIGDDIDGIASRLNRPDGSGLRMMAVRGEIVTEIEALAGLAGVEARLIAAGGVCGAEGAVWLDIGGSEEKLARAKGVIDAVAGEEPFAF